MSGRFPDRWEPDFDPDRLPGPPPGPTELPCDPDDDIETIVRKRAAAAFRATAWRMPAEPGFAADPEDAAKLGEAIAELELDFDDPDSDDADE